MWMLLYLLYLYLFAEDWLCLNLSHLLAASEIWCDSTDDETDTTTSISSHAFLAHLSWILLSSIIISVFPSNSLHISQFLKLDMILQASILSFYRMTICLFFLTFLQYIRPRETSHFLPVDCFFQLLPMKPSHTFPILLRNLPKSFRTDSCSSAHFLLFDTRRSAHLLHCTIMTLADGSWVNQLHQQKQSFYVLVDFILSTSTHNEWKSPPAQPSFEPGKSSNNQNLRSPRASWTIGASKRSISMNTSYLVCLAFPQTTLVAYLECWEVDVGEYNCDNGTKYLIWKPIHPAVDLWRW